ncbi:MAG: PorV/PorQ family protein [Candidatus Zhuqueibacterota bacterium]
MKIKLLSIVLMIFVAGIIDESFSFNKVGSTTAQFLKIESGPRTIGMGGCYTSRANDPFAMYWNVAGIAQINSISTSMAYTNWIADLKHSYTGIVIPAGGFGNFGLSVTTLNSDKIEQTTILNPQGTGTFMEASDIALGFSYARFMTDFVSVGFTAKYIQQKLWDLSAETFAFDIGFLLNTGFRGVKLGMTLNNFGPEMQMGGDNLIRSFDKWPENNADPNVQVGLKTSTWPIPTSYRVSLSIDLFGNEESSMIGSGGNNQMVFAVDALHPSDNPEHYSFGLEYSYRHMLFARTGYKGGTDEQGLTVGAGFNLDMGNNIELSIDYAYADFGVFQDIQQVSIGFTF